MPGRNRGPTIRESQRDVSHETGERLVENNDSGKWLDSLKNKASEEMKGILKENSQAYTTRQVFFISSTILTRAEPNPRIIEMPAETHPTFQESALDEIARGREEHIRLCKLLEDAELMVKDIRDFQASKDAEEKFSREADVWLKAEREKALKAVGETSTKANAHVEKGVLQFAKRCSL